jgi:REP element-mobilizing transposase RayT
MAHTYIVAYLHIVFSTKERAATITPELDPKVRDYMIGVAQKCGAAVHAIGGTANHVHILLNLPADICVAKLVQSLKGSTSHWLNEQNNELHFAWQQGYSAFSVSASQLPAVVQYIENQAEHHAKWSFEQEFASLLKKCGVDYDPRHVFG